MESLTQPFGLDSGAVEPDHEIVSCKTAFVELEPVPAVTQQIRIAVIGVRGLPDISGGIERHCEALYPSLADDTAGFAIHILTRRRYLKAARSHLANVEIIGLFSPKGTALETTFHTAWGILYAVTRLSVDIIHLHGIGPGFFAPLARVFGKRVVVTHHATDFARPKWGLAGRSFLKLGERAAATFADRVVCVSNALRLDFLSRFPNARGRTVAIPHGVGTMPRPTDVDLALHGMGLERGRYSLAVGRLDETKRFSDLIAAHALAGPLALPLVIAGGSFGDVSYEESLRAAAGPNVHFVGHRFGPDLSSLYVGAALFIHPSAMEGFGLVVLEALAAGLPVAASDIPPHRDFGLPEQAYFAVGDIPAIARLFRTTEPEPMPQRQSLAIAARYGHEAMIAAYAALFKAMMAD